MNLHEHCREAFFQENEKLVEWVNQQPLATPLTCLGDGHDGIWNLFEDIASDNQRQEILDWFHLKENLHKVGGSEQRLATVEALLWRGDVVAAIEQFNDWQHERVDTINCLSQQASTSDYQLRLLPSRRYFYWLGDN